MRRNAVADAEAGVLDIAPGVDLAVVPAVGFGTRLDFEHDGC